jgi:hypothetical protein
MFHGKPHRRLDFLHTFTVLLPPRSLLGLLAAFAMVSSLHGYRVPPMHGGLRIAKNGCYKSEGNEC